MCLNLLLMILRKLLLKDLLFNLLMQFVKELECCGFLIFVKCTSVAFNVGTLVDQRLSEFMK